MPKSLTKFCLNQSLHPIIDDAGEAASAVSPCCHAAVYAPPWFQRVGSTVKKKGLKDVNVNFAVACSGCKKKQQTICVGNSNGLAKAQIIGDAIERVHRECQVIIPSCTAPQDPFLASAAEIERLEKELGQQRRQMEEFQRENGQLKRTAEQARLNKQQQSTAQRLKNRQGQQGAANRPRQSDTIWQGCQELEDAGYKRRGHRQGHGRPL